MAYLFYFCVSSLLTTTMPTAVLVIFLGSQIKNEWVTNLGYILVLISWLPSLAWNVAALIAGFNLVRTSEKVTSQMNLAALTAFAHCGFYAIMQAICTWQNNRVLSDTDDPFDSEDRMMLRFGTFSVIYLYALASANFYQAFAFWKKKTTHNEHN